MEKRYSFTRNNVLIGTPSSDKEKVLALARQTQKADHMIGEDKVQTASGDFKQVLYKVEERELVGISSYKRTYNDTILPPIVKDDAVPARLDSDRTAKPLNKIAVQLNPEKRFYGVKPFHSPSLVTDNGEKIKLYN